MKNFILIVSCFFAFQTITAKTEVKKTVEKKSITIYWDASLSMKNKDVSKEFSFLDTYFRSIQNADVRLVTFANTIELVQVYTVKNADWVNLKTQLLKTNYDGIAEYSLLKKEYDSDINLLFTDGRGVYDNLSLDTNKLTHSISSQVDSDNFILRRESQKTNGYHINLKFLNIDKALKLIGVSTSQKIVSKKSYSKKNKGVTQGILSGIVSDNATVLQGVSIRVKNSNKSVVSNEKGEFSIDVKKGDVLEFNFLGKTPLSILVDDFTLLKIFLNDKKNILDEVVVKGNDIKEEIVESGYGKRDKKRIGYAVRTIDSKTINSGVASTLSDAVAGKMGGTQNGFRDISNTVFRGGNTILGNKFPLIVIDGLPMKRNDSDDKNVQPIRLSAIVSSAKGTAATTVEPQTTPNIIYINKNSNLTQNTLTDFIDPNNVESMTVLKGIAATNRFGSEGVNGVILITTKTSLGAVNNGKVINSALVKNNNYNDDLTFVENPGAKYNALYKNSISANDIYELYLSSRDRYLNDPLFFIETSKHIYELGNEQLAFKVFSNTFELFRNNASVLKYIAYKSEEIGYLLFALEIYKRIVKINPNEAQPYRDLAIALQYNEKRQEALNIYNDIFNNKYVNKVNFSGLNKSLKKEANHLIILHKDKLDLRNTPSDIIDLKRNKSETRLVFEWNNSDVEFEVQFVNPQKKFFTWSHTASENSSRITKEKQQGFYTEEFMFESVGQGEWIVNIDNKLGSKNDIKVVKFTLYHNYGEPNETIEVKLLDLNTIKGKKMISKIKI